MNKWHGKSHLDVPMAVEAMQARLDRMPDAMRVRRRTVEHVFGIAPITLFDRLAMPMHEAFLPSLSARDSARQLPPVVVAVIVRPDSAPAEY